MLGSDGSPCGAADAAAVERLYVALRRRCIAAAREILHDAHEAEDAVHDAFVIALTRGHTLRDPASAPAWILRIVRNVATSRGRRRRKMRPSSILCAEGDDGPADQGGTPSAAAADGARLASAPGREPDPSELATFRSTVDAFPPDLRRVFDLIVEQGGSAAVLARAEGVAEGCIRQRVYRVRRALDPSADDGARCGVQSRGRSRR